MHCSSPITSITLLDRRWLSDEYTPSLPFTVTAHHKETGVSSYVESIESRRSTKTLSFPYLMW